MKLLRKICVKALLVLTLASLVTVGGCETIKNGVTGAQSLLCNPTDTMKQDAALACGVADALLAVLVNVPQTASVAALITSLGGAKTIFATVESGGCVLATQLAQALDALDQAQTAKAMLIKAASKGAMPPLTSLRDWVR